MKLTRKQKKLVPIVRRNAISACTEDKLLMYEKIPGHTRRPWRCPRFLNSGAYAGLAPSIGRLARLWAQQKLFRADCRARPIEGVNDQCVCSAHNDAPALSVLACLVHCLCLTMSSVPWMFALDLCLDVRGAGIAMMIQLQQNVSIALDNHERLFSAGGTAVAPLRLPVWWRSLVNR